MARILSKIESDKVKEIIENKVKNGKLMMSKPTEYDLIVIYYPSNKGSDFHLTIVNWRRLHWTYNGKLKNIRISVNGDLKTKDLEDLDIEWALELQKELKVVIPSKLETKQKKKSGKINKNKLLKQIKIKDKEISNLNRKLEKLEHKYSELIIEKD